MDYIELTVSVRPQAAEEIADLARRYAPAGVSIEPAFEALDEEGRVALDGDAPLTLRAWLPANATGRATVNSFRRDLRSMPDALAGPLRARTVSDGSWKDAWKRHFPVTRIGRRIVIKPSWRKHRGRRDDVVIELDPGMAFGTGQHATTRLCLEALEQRMESGARVLDVGCGSGILSVVAALLGAAQVDALDIDPAAVRATKENAARNAARVRVLKGSLGEAWPFRHRPGGRYDILLANISAHAVRELARPLVAALSGEGVAIISGVIEGQEASCLHALQSAGAQIEDVRREDGWALITARPTERSPRTSTARDRPQRRRR